LILYRKRKIKRNGKKRRGLRGTLFPLKEKRRNIGSPKREKEGFKGNLGSPKIEIEYSLFKHIIL